MSDPAELTPEQIAAFHRAAATLKDEDFTPEEMTGIRRGWLGLVKDRANAGPGVHYEQPAIRGQPPRGSFRLPRDIISKLGGGNPQAGGAVAHGLFGIEPDGDPTVVHADVVRDIGHGDIKAGRRILDRFVAMVRRQGAQPHDDYLQPDGTRPARVIR